MKNRIFLILESLLLLVGILAFQGCFEEHRYVAPEPVYVAPEPVYGPPYGVYGYGDYDEHRAWHDRDWWVANRHDWVQQHHPDWFGSKEHHEEHHEEHHDHD